MVSFHAFPKYTEQHEKWIRAIHRDFNGEMIPKTARVCIKHFTDSDFKVTSTDSNYYREKKLNGITLKLLKDDAVPSIYPSLPAYLSNTPVLRRSSATSAASKYDKSIQKYEVLETAFWESDRVFNFDQLL